MIDYITSTTKPTIDEKGNKTIEYILEDKDFLLIKAIQDLTNQIKRIADK